MILIALFMSHRRWFLVVVSGSHPRSLTSCRHAHRHSGLLSASVVNTSGTVRKFLFELQGRPPSATHETDVETEGSVSTATVARHFDHAEGVIDLGTPGTMNQRRKRLLSIPRSTLDGYNAAKQVKTRRIR